MMEQWDMKIYVSFDSNIEKSKFIAETLQSFGHEIINAQLINENAVSKEKMLSRFWRYERNKKRIKECDCIIADVSEPGFNAGYDVGFALGAAKRIYLFYTENLEDEISITITGNSELNVMKFPYSNKEQLKQLLSENFRLVQTVSKGEAQ